MPSSRNAIFVALLLTLTSVLSGCGGQAAGLSPVNRSTVSTVSTAGAAQPAGTPYAEPTAAPMPACAKAGTPVALPTGYPAAFPMPPGMVLASQEVRSDGVVVTGIVPSTARDVAIFFKDALGRAGFKSGEGDSEPGEAESEYAGQGYVGRWKVNDIKGCPGAATLILFAGH